MIMLAYLGLALWFGTVGMITVVVSRLGRHSRRADELADVWYQRRAEARLRALGDEQRRYAEAVTALVAEDAVHEWELMLAEARG